MTRRAADARSAETADTPLSDLLPGARAIITAVGADAACLDPGAPHGRLARRLHDLGLIPGRAITARRRAPLGDPTVFQVADYELCLRRHDAALVTVRVIDDAPDPAARAAGAAS
ncbi:hypothetical protein B6G06_09410 [Actinomyces gaoshouyii]|uniref:Iron transporter n=1 Tax=Actinomyces gaoshouyii TaxID=1960083 RepID=A0A8H9LKP8_9ACTO|nr:hypothetical protein B6G06_09410 [Actinomyces gaoshouyii]GGO95358.1 iron transporter [Actinomyces gaoshouyii]